MESRAKVFGHPIHQILIVFPLGLLSTTVAFDAIRLVTGNEKWSVASHKMLGAGLISAMVAAPFGLIDWVAIPSGTRAKRIGTLHGLGNLAVVGLFGASWLLRRGNPEKNVILPGILAAMGGALAGVTGWLGGELVDTHGIGVRADAGVDAESSIARGPLVDITIPAPGEAAGEPEPADDVPSPVPT
jgi:uncharacterized membrane protein